MAHKTEVGKLLSTFFLVLSPYSRSRQLCLSLDFDVIQLLRPLHVSLRQRDGDLAGSDYSPSRQHSFFHIIVQGGALRRQQRTQALAALGMVVINSTSKSA
jgi:hypothetical protein